VKAAITLGGRGMVDGIIVLAEHGDYPYTEHGASFCCASALFRFVSSSGLPRYLSIYLARGAQTASVIIWHSVFASVRHASTQHIIV
jgi:hypothetical protein